MTKGECDALILAEAGITRLGEGALIAERLETSYFVPAVGQGSIALECHKKLSFEKKEAIRSIVNDPVTEICIRAERAFLKRLQGGCSIPAFGYAQLSNSLITLKAGIISLDGSRMIKLKDEAVDSLAEELGYRIAGEVLDQGGDAILRELRQS
jgi:hydroxymethylbilane synthase